MNGDDYIKDQEALYIEKVDPWENLSGPRYNIYRQYHKIIASLILPKYKTVVDIGCGVGGLVNSINTTTEIKARGVDSSKRAIETAKRNFPAWDYEVGDVRFWKPHLKVDMVLVTGPYHHLTVEERFAALHHIRSYLTPGGALLIAYGGAANLDGEDINYPVLSDEIFSVFERQQYIDYMYKDGNQNGSWVFYVGEK